MYGWIILSAALTAACAALAAVCARQRRLLRGQARKSDAGRESERRELRALRDENERRIRAFASLRQALDGERLRAESLEDAVAAAEAREAEANDRARRAEARRAEADRDAAAAGMRAGLLEKQVERLTREQRAQEQIYQDILREREEELDRLRESVKRRQRRRSEVLDQQITLDDWLRAAQGAGDTGAPAQRPPAAEVAGESGNRGAADMKRRKGKPTAC